VIPDLNFFFGNDKYDFLFKVFMLIDSNNSANFPFDFGHSRKWRNIISEIRRKYGVRIYCIAYYS